MGRITLIFALVGIGMMLFGMVRPSATAQTRSNLAVFGAALLTFAVVAGGFDPFVYMAIILIALTFGRAQQDGSSWSERGLRWGFALVFTLFAAGSIVWLIAGLAPAVVAASPALQDSLRERGGTTRPGLVVTSEGRDFDAKRLLLPPGRRVSIEYRNLDDDFHNISIYRDPSLEKGVYRGHIILGPLTTEYRFKTPATGEYVFICDYHPDMEGDVKVAPGLTPQTEQPSTDRAESLARRLYLASLDAKPATYVIPTYLFSILNLTLAIFLVVKERGQRVARLLALGMIGTAAVFNLQAHSALALIPFIEYPHDFFHSLSGSSYLLALLLFPDGHFRHSRWPSWFAVPLRALGVLVLVMAGVQLSFLFHGDPAGFVAFFGVAIPLVGVGAQSLRLRSSRGPEERQQSRVLLWALGLALIGVIAAGGFQLIAVQGSDIEALFFRLFPLLFAIIPVTLFVVLVRYRLWDMDRVINRAMVYGTLTGILALLYLGLVFTLRQVIAGVAPGAGDDEMIVAASTLAVAGAFRPLRTRTQGAIDRRFYRHRYDAAATVADYSQHLRARVDLDEVSHATVEVVKEAIEPAHVGLWLRRSPQG